MNTPEQFYKHYKGGYYKVITYNVQVINRLSYPLTKKEWDYVATFEGDLAIALIYKLDDLTYITYSSTKYLVDDTYVLYQSMKYTDQYYLRPFKEFMGTVNLTATEALSKEVIVRFHRISKESIPIDYNQ